MIFCLGNMQLILHLYRLLVFLLLALFFEPSLALAADNSVQEAKGRELYVHGTFSRESEPMALIGPESTPMPASVVPCASCHGDDGAGRPEGAVVPPDTTWRYLTKPYGHKHSNGRAHPAFSVKSLAVAIQKGIDPAGNPLDSSMPRYRFSSKQMSALIAYLKKIDTDSAPGVSEDSIHVGVVLPLKGTLAEIGKDIKSVLVATFNEINEHGGIYNRKIQLQLIDSSDPPNITLANVSDLLKNQQVFALMGPSITWVENELPALAEQEKVPFLGSLNSYADDGSAPNRYSFYLFSGIKDLMRILTDYTAENLRLINPRVAVVYPENGVLLETLTAIDEQGNKYHWACPKKIAYQPGRFDASATVRDLKEQGADVVYFLGRGPELKEFMEVVNTTDWLPYILIPGSSIQSDVFFVSNDLLSRILLAYPTVPTDWSSEGIAAFNALQKKNNFTTHHIATLVMAYCSAQLLEQGLKLAGRQVSRGKFLSALEGLYDFETGLTPKLSYGPNRHTGAIGAYVVAIDPKNKQFRILSDRLVPKDYGPPVN